LAGFSRFKPINQELVMNLRTQFRIGNGRVAGDLVLPQGARRESAMRGSAQRKSGNLTDRAWEAHILYGSSTDEQRSSSGKDPATRRAAFWRALGCVAPHSESAAAFFLRRVPPWRDQPARQKTARPFPILNWVLKTFLLCFLPVVPVFAGDTTAQFNSSTILPLPMNDPARIHNMLTVKSDSPLVVLGKTDFTISGPLIEGFRRLPKAENLSLGQKFLRLPVIRLFVPRPMESPPGTGRYFMWRSSDLPWTAAASRRPILKGPISY
jgi:hypothetical protein